jgi:hypothetical protein
MENYYRTHHANYSKRTFPEFINSFTAMLTPLDPLKREKKNDKDDDEEDHEDEEEDEEGEEPPSHFNLIWDEEEFGDDDNDDIMKEA